MINSNPWFLLNPALVYLTSLPHPSLLKQLNTTLRVMVVLLMLLGQPMTTHAQPATIDALFHDLAFASKPNARIVAAQKLATLLDGSGAHPMLEVLAKERNAKVRRHVIEAVATIPDVRIMPPLLFHRHHNHQLSQADLQQLDAIFLHCQKSFLREDWLSATTGVPADRQVILTVHQVLKKGVLPSPNCPLPSASVTFSDYVNYRNLVAPVPLEALPESQAKTASSDPGRKLITHEVPAPTALDGYAADVAVLSAQLKARYSHIDNCYLAALTRDPKKISKLEGKLSMEVVIIGDGSVERVTMTQDTLNDRGLNRCIDQVVRATPFSKTGIGEVKIQSHFHFKPPEQLDLIKFESPSP